MRKQWKSFVAVCLLSLLLAPQAWGATLLYPTGTHTVVDKDGSDPTDIEDLYSWNPVDDEFGFPTTVTVNIAAGARVNLLPSDYMQVNPSVLQLVGNSDPASPTTINAENDIYVNTTLSLLGNLGTNFALGVDGGKELTVQGVKLGNGTSATLSKIGNGKLTIESSVGTGVDLYAGNGTVALGTVAGVTFNKLTVAGANMIIPKLVTTVNDLILQTPATFDAGATVGGNLQIDQGATFIGVTSVTGTMKADGGESKFIAYAKADTVEAINSGTKAEFRSTSDFGDVNLPSGQALFGGNTNITRRLTLNGGTLSLENKVNINPTTAGATGVFSSGTLEFTLSAAGATNNIAFNAITLSKGLDVEMTSFFDLSSIEIFTMKQFSALMTSSSLTITGGSLDTYDYFGYDAGGNWGSHSLSDIVFSWRESLGTGAYMDWMLRKEGNNLVLYGFEVPEPSTYAMFLSGVFALGYFGRRRAMKKK